MESWHGKRILLSLPRKSKGDMKSIAQLKWQKALVWPAFFLGLLPGLNEQYRRLIKRHYYTQGASCGLIRAYAREFEKANGRKPNDVELVEWGAGRFAEDLQRMEYVPDESEKQVRFRWVP